MSKIELPVKSGKIYKYNCDYCSVEKNFYRACEYCKKDVCVDCAEFIAKDLFQKDKQLGRFVCLECLDRFNERYKKTATHLNNALTEFELEFKNERNTKS